MAASLSRPDPSSPASVAEAGFATARKGFNQDEVRAFLTSVAAELGRLQERERQLQGEIRELHRRPAADVELDEAMLTEMLGEETLRVLQTARESASDIKIRAEENAARVLRDANDEANRLRQDAEVEAARKRQDAAADAEAEVALAKQQGREMVNEARAYRERVLADLDRRTTLARQQIEELVQGRDRLLQVFERARLVAVDVTSGLQAIDGPEELVNLSPTTGPVPLMVKTEHRDPEPEAEATDDDDDHDDDGDDTTDVSHDDAVDVAVDEVTDDGEAAGDEQPETDVEDAAADDADDDASEDDDAAASDGNVVSLFRDRAAPEAGDEVTEEAPDVEGIFERLRSEVPTDDAADDTADDTDAGDDRSDDADTDDDEAAEAPEPTPFSRRDEAVVPLIVAGARKVKRVLADEQNGALDALRQKTPVTSIDDLLADTDAHVATYVDALADDLVSAAAAGATEIGVNDTKTLRRKLVKAGALEAAHGQIANNLVGPLRERLTRAVADGAGDNDEVTKRIRAVYREWKTQHIDDQLDDVFRFAHGGGLATIVEPGTALIWIIDPSEPACADCEDNSLAGDVAAGDPFPTGHVSAPAHPGCRCLTVPASQ